MSAFVILLAASPSAASAKGRHHHGAAKAGGKRIAITSSPGGGAAEGPVRAQVAKALKRARIKPVSQKKGAAPGDDQQWVALSQKLKADGFVQLAFEGGHGRQSVEISIRTGVDGSTVGSETFTAEGPPARLGKAVAKNFWKKLGGAIKQTSPARRSESTGMPPRDLSHEETTSPAAAAETPAEPETPTATPEAEKPSGETAAPAAAPPEEAPEAAQAEETKPAAPPPPAPEVGGLGPREPELMGVLQARYLSRSFTYTPSSAAPSSDSVAPTIGAQLMWFPLDHFGLEVGGEFENWLKQLGQYPTASSDLHASLVYRLPLSFGDLYVRAGGFRHFFATTDDGSNTRQNLSVPDVVYVGARAGGGLGLHLTRALSLMVEGDYRLITNMIGGPFPVNAHFPRATSGPGFDGAVTLAFRLTRLLELQAGGDIRRYVIATAGMPGDRIDASGATDLYLSGWIGVGGVYGGR